MSLKGMARETLRIVEQGAYGAPSGRRVSLGDAVERATAGTRLYRPSDFESLTRPPPQSEALRLEVTAEKTGEAARRLLETEGAEHVALLNFASAKNPGGGFLGGARAQEEDLSRCSALYTCQLRQPDYYTHNRREPSMLYTEHLLYSPEVPFFRDEQGTLLERPFLASVITSPAPNAGEALRRDASLRPRIREVLEARARNVLRVAAHHGHRTLVLGAWGCGVFRNDPREVAEVFAQALVLLPGAFARVVFAVYERGGDGPNLRAFRERFGQASASR